MWEEIKYPDSLGYNMEAHLEGSECGRYVYQVITENGEEIDRYLVEDRMESNW